MIVENPRTGIYVNAIKKWGVTAQLDMVIEECSGLIKAIQKFKRVKEKDDEDLAIQNIQEEVADVEIMIDQMRVMFSDKDIDAHKAFKINRLKERLDGK